MGDSDEEYDRRKVGRDKFRRERSDYEVRGGTSGGSSNVGRREAYEERSSSRSNDYSNQGGSSMGGSSSGLKKYGASGSYHDRRPASGSGSGGYGEPPLKRSRREWPEGSSGYESNKTTTQNSGGTSNSSNTRERDAGNESENRPRIMLSFKQFLYQQDDNITDEEAMQKYKEYKEDFARQQLLDFFNAHKDEEWFKEKYHPDYCEQRLAQHRRNVLRRKEVFLELMNKGWIDGREAHVKETNNLVRLMNAIVIKLEDGNDDDLRILDMADADITFASLASSAAAAALAAPSQNASNTPSDRKKEGETGNLDKSGKSRGSVEKKSKNKAKENDEEDLEKKRRKSSPHKSRKSRSGDKYSDDDDDSGSGSDSDSGSASDDSFDHSSRGSSSSEDDSGDEDNRGSKKRSRRAEKDEGRDSENEAESGEDGEEEEDEEESEAKSSRHRKRSRKSSDISIESGPVEEEKKNNEGGDDGQVIDDEQEEGQTDDKDEDEIEVDDKQKDDSMKDEGVDVSESKSDKSPSKETSDSALPQTSLQKMPRALHKTHSIFLRNLHPSITRQEIEGLCKAYPGFKRLALQDPAPERKFFRRGWVTFDRSVNIKEICWNLNNIRLKDCDLGAIVNRELTQRVRPVMVLANHKPVMRQDVKFAAKIVQKLDQKYELWSVEESNNVAKSAVLAPPTAAGVDVSNQFSFNLLVSPNPLMKNITEYLVDEGSYEEEALLGVGSDDVMGEDGSEGENKIIDKIEEDKELVRVLDRLVLYLRIVHSVDYYSCTEYPNEDEMPHRCGIIHARGAHIQPDKALTQRDVEEYMKQFEAKAAHLVEGSDTINEDAVKKLGVRDPETAVEDFITSNTQELAKDKWLCPLSGKKFKGPEFVRKHITNKHGERLDEVRSQTAYFNHYLRDPKRPQLPEMRPAASREERNGSGTSSSNFRSGSGGGAGGSHDRPGPVGDYPSRNPASGFRGRSPSDRNVGGSGSDYYGASEYGDYRGYGQGAAREFRSPPPPHGYARDYYSASRVPYAQYSNFRRQQQYYAESMRRQAGGYGQRPQSFGGRRLMNYKDLDAPEETY